MAALEVACVPALSDNYIWMIHDPASGDTVVVDPGEAAPALAAAGERGWRIGQVWITHWHPDHTAGIAEVKAATGATVSGPQAEADKIVAAGKIAALDVLLGEGDPMRVGEHVATVLETPGHTAGHITFHFADDRLLFPGDTLFAMGCGRLFEGTAEQMFANFRRFARMPPETRAYGAHEYTQANGRFALSEEPDNAALIERMRRVDAMCAAGEPTLPTTIGEELATSPFLRASSAEEFARLRAGKDAFRG